MPLLMWTGAPLVLEMGIGITDRKQAQETLRESEERLRLTSKQSITAQERERQRLSLELHDDPGQLSWQDMS